MKEGRAHASAWALNRHYHKSGKSSSLSKKDIKTLTKQANEVTCDSSSMDVEKIEFKKEVVTGKSDNEDTHYCRMYKMTMQILQAERMDQVKELKLERESLIERINSIEKKINEIEAQIIIDSEDME